MLFKEMTSEEMEELWYRDGRNAGHKAGLEQGLVKERSRVVKNLSGKGLSNDEIAEMMDTDATDVKKAFKEAEDHEK